MSSRGEGKVIDAKVVTADTMTDYNGDFTMYRIAVRTRESNHIVLRRFSRFQDFAVEIRQFYMQHHPHLEDSLPRLPNKHFKWVIDHLSDSFIEGRMQDLSNYLKNLLTLPYITTSPILHEFLDLDPLQK